MNSPDHMLFDNIFLRSWRPALWLVLVAAIPYLHILTFSEYTYFDDHFLIVENFSYIDEWSDAGHAFLEDVSHQGQGGNLYRPFLTLSFILSAKISGTSPWGYHGIDILLHCIAGCLLFYTLQILGFKKNRSFFGALIFCVHPALTQAVAWIAGRNDSLLTVFILLSFISFIKFLSTSKMRWFFLHMLGFACALFTKESAIVFPVLALLYIAIIKKEEAWSLTTLLHLAAWGMIIVQWSILRHAAMIIPVEKSAQAATTVLSNLWIAVYYFGKLFWPFQPAFAPVFADIHITAGIVALIVLAAALVLSERKDWKFILFGALWFLAFLVPTFYSHSGVHTPPKFYEHRIYLSSVGVFFILLSCSWTSWFERIKKILPLLFILVLMLFGGMSVMRTFHFKNSLTLGEYDASTSPHDPRRYNDIKRMSVPRLLDDQVRILRGGAPQRGEMPAVSQDELSKIIDELGNKVKFNDTDAVVHHALAVAYFARGLYLSSESNFLAALRVHPRDAALYYNLGVMYYAAHAIAQAENAWKDALQIDPAGGNAHLNLSYLYYETGQYQSAWDHCRRAMELGIAEPEGLVNEIRKKL
ncbi:MAG: hypothetical protein EHM64_07025 [Ignavibacteriae bacterium]|nr:MAG: hypothetical protein EHM64_07025 [Ignavibacteriota bacterium]